MISRLNPLLATLIFLAALVAGAGAAEAPAGRGNAWQRLPDLPTARLAAGAVALNGRIFVIGGCLVRSHEVVPVDAVEAYDPLTRTWAKMAPLPTPRSSFGIAVVAGRIFVIGGTRSDTRSAEATVEAYDPTTGRWSAAAPLPTPRSQVGAAAVGGVIYAVGGNAGHESVFESYDPRADRWTALPALPAARRNAGVVASASRLFVFGGVAPDGWTPVASLDVYDPATGTWRRCTPAARGRTDHATVACGGSILAVGGFNQGALATVARYSIADDRWSDRPGLPAPAQFAAAAMLDGRVYVVGGTPLLPQASGLFMVCRTGLFNRPPL